jgi:hypothetical protein
MTTSPQAEAGPATDVEFIEDLAAESAETVELVHGEDGTSVRLEGVTGLEIAAIVVLGALVLVGIRLARRTSDRS